MEQGIIKTVTDKGFGFISREGQTKDLFFHSSKLKNCNFDELKKGDAVEFEVEQAEKGPCAVNIYLMSN